MKKILVPTDFSTYSENAIRVAEYFARIKQMEIKLVHVIEDPLLPFYKVEGELTFVNDIFQDYSAQLEETTREHLSRTIQRVPTGGTIDIRHEVVKSQSGVANSIIHQASDVLGADLIVMGTKGRNNDENFFMGSTTQKVVRLASAPVLAVGNIPANFTIEKILFASDFKEPSIATIIPRIIKLSQIMNAELHFVRVNLPGNLVTPEEITAQKQHFNINDTPFHLVTAPSEEDGIFRCAKEINASLIALCTHGRTGIPYLLKGSIAEDIASQTNIPILTYNINPDKIYKSAKPIMGKPE